MNKVKNPPFFIAIIFAFTLLFSSTAAAATNDPKLTVVSLGDSITFGLNLEKQTDAFPYLIGTGNTEVLNVSFPGWTSTQLLEAVSKEGSQMMLQQADVVTLNIGANDLLQAVEVEKLLNAQEPIDQEALKLKVANASVLIYNNVTQIISLIKTQTDAPILLYSIYNPFGQNHPLHLLGESITNGLGGEPGVNPSVFGAIAFQQEVHYLDAYSAFHGKQQEYIIPGDIHPTVSGHQALANLATNRLLELNPITVIPTFSTEEETSDPVIIELGEIQDLIEAKWLAGEKTVTDFLNDGNMVENNIFSVTTNGKYTLYVKTTLGESVQTIEVSNIIPKVEEPIKEEDPPVNEEEPPAEEEQPPVTVDPEVEPTTSQPEKTSEEKEPVQTPEKKVEAPKVEKPETPMVKNGHALPNTATSTYNILLAGLCIVAVGGGVLVTQRTRKLNK